MSHKTFGLADGKPNPGSSPAFHVFVAYESVESCHQAWSLCRRPVESLGQGLDLKTAFCPLDVLACKDRHEETVEAVAQADIVLFAMNIDSRLTPGMIYWIESWIPKKETDSGGLLLLIESGGKPKHSQSFTETYLQGVAKRAGMDFLTQKVCVSATPRPMVRDESWVPSGTALRHRFTPRAQNPPSSGVPVYMTNAFTQ